MAATKDVATSRFSENCGTNKLRAVNAGQGHTFLVDPWKLTGNTYPDIVAHCGDIIQFVWPAGETHGVASIPTGRDDVHPPHCCAWPHLTHMWSIGSIG